MRLLCALLVLIAVALARSDAEQQTQIDFETMRSQISTVIGQLESKQKQIDVLKERLDDKQKAEILFYRDRTDCPTGYSPMENSYGRLIVIEGPSRGTVSDHTFADERVLAMPCKQRIGVAETGFHQVCGSSTEDDNTPVTVDLENLLPNIKLLACFRDKGPAPVIP